MLGNISYVNPTTLHFGKESLNELKNELTHYGANILLIYGGGSIKKTGLYDQIMTILNDLNKNVFEESGVMPNPTLEKLYSGAKNARENNVDFILAVGGGSVVDYAKGVAASAYCDEDPWQKYWVEMKDVDNKIIPLGAILTMVGTGSEMNGGSVITNTETKMKIGRVFDTNNYPRFAILNPELTYTIPKYQMVSGFFDIMSHIMEQYFSGDDDNTSDYLAEGLMKSLVHSSLIAIENPTDYEARSNIMWTATWALNKLIAQGKTEDWEVHMIGQAIGAHTNATHGMTLASVSLPYYRFILKDGLAKFKRFAINVWNVNPNDKDDLTIANEGLNALEEWMKTIGVTLNAGELGVREDMLDAIADSTFLLDGGYRVLTHEDVVSILKDSLNYK